MMKYSLWILVTILLYLVKSTSSIITKQPPALFSIDSYGWSAPSADTGMFHVTISAQPGLTVRPFLTQDVIHEGGLLTKRDVSAGLDMYAMYYDVMIDSSDTSFTYAVPVLSVPGQEVDTQTRWVGGQQEMSLTVDYHPAPRSPIQLSLRIIITGTSHIDYQRGHIFEIPAYVEATNISNGPLSMIEVTQSLPTEITTEQLRNNPPQLKIRIPDRAYTYYVWGYQGSWYRDGMESVNTEAGITTCSLRPPDASIPDEDLTGRYMATVEYSNYGDDESESVHSMIYIKDNGQSTASPELRATPCNILGNNNTFSDTDVHYTYIWRAGLPNCACCVVEGVSAEVSMWRNGHELTEQALFDSENLMEMQGGLSLCLVVQEASEQSAGDYSCRGQAAGGWNDTKTFSVSLN